MDARTLATVLVGIFNEAAEELEKLLASDGEDDADDDKKKKKKKKGDDDDDSDDDADEPKKKKKKSDDDDDDDKDDDEPSAEDVTKAARAAVKKLGKDAVAKIIKKKGKADRSAEVEEEYRQAVIDALSKAVEDAE